MHRSIPAAPIPPPSRDNPWALVSSFVLEISRGEDEGRGQMPYPWDIIAYMYHKMLIISPGLIFVQKAFLLALFSAELVFGGACYRKEFCISRWVWLVNENS